MTVFLSQNSPNPFNAQTVIEFRVPQTDVVSLSVYDMLGRHVRTLFEGEVAAGQTYRLRFHGDNLAGGVYLYTLVTRSHAPIVKRLLYLK